MKRRLAREMVVSSLYQLELNDVEVFEALEMIIEEIKADDEVSDKISDEATDEFARKLLLGVNEHKAAIDDLLTSHLTGWQVDRLSRVDLQILRLACFEMVFSKDAPPKVAVNEAIELAKHFGTEESGKFVNGVLAKLLQNLDLEKA
ncbi:MAG: transcription antitermination factor NusB [Candidatus Pristimantibacillus lignocellulolyticus]|uniref:Transcription antitermination protein NusB n=1 Tax=Candidatus Pristimantibacillus lignocellulolyticus TaxID=2994561 RepID=A0A9J6ZDZ7_9BACL|nr:MAG: transcription antitermination factor NusB [Candidatus Pristimantibacillus lignocellulolyticus]